MIYIQVEDSQEDVVKVTGMNFFPKHPDYGISKPESEFYDFEFFVDEVPEAENNGKSYVLWYDKKEKKFSYEYFQTKTYEQESLISRLHTPSEKFEIYNTPYADLETLRTLRLLKLKEECTQAIYDGFESQGHTFGFNEHDQSNFTQQLLLIALGDTSPIQWKTQDAGVQEFTTGEFQQIVDDAKAHKIAQQTKYWTLENELEAATTIEEVNSIVW